MAPPVLDVTIIVACSASGASPGERPMPSSRPGARVGWFGHSRRDRFMIFDRDAVRDALPGYELGDQLGRGAFGLVLAGRDPLGRDVAIKVVGPVEGGAPRPGGTPRPDPLGPLGSDGPLGEAVMLARLSHPHIVPVFHGGSTPQVTVIVMELLRGGSLRDRLRLGGLTPEWACAVVLAVAAALEAAHDKQLLHRDVKPENILFTADGLPKMTDFGIARVLL